MGRPQGKSGRWGKAQKREREALECRPTSAKAHMNGKHRGRVSGRGRVSTTHPREEPTGRTPSRGDVWFWCRGPWAVLCVESRRGYGIPVLLSGSSRSPLARNASRLSNIGSMGRRIWHAVAHAPRRSPPYHHHTRHTHGARQRRLGEGREGAGTHEKRTFHHPATKARRAS